MMIPLVIVIAALTIIACSSYHRNGLSHAPIRIRRSLVLQSDIAFPSSSSSSSIPSSIPSSSSSSSEGKDLKLGVLLLNLGGPEKTEDVEGFLYNLFADPDIIRLPSFLSILQKPLAYFIAKRRAPKSTAAYESIGGGSPIVKYTQAQADLLGTRLSKLGFDAKCYFAMRYWNPYTEEVLEEIKNDDISTLVIVPLYPQYSISTSGSSLKLLQDAFFREPEKWGPDKVSHTVVPAWYYRKGYLTAMGGLILKEIAKYNIDEIKEGIDVLYSAHGVPQSYIQAGDPYQRQIEECVRLISKELITQLKDDKLRPPSITKEAADILTGDTDSSGKCNLNIHLSFQSKVGPVKWLQPYTEEMLETLGNNGVKNLVVVPVSFVSEHIETLEEIDMEYKEVAEEYGIKHWERSPALNMDVTFIEDMADMVIEALATPALSLAEAAAQELDQQSSKDAYKEKLGGFGIDQAEVINGRFAMIGIFATALVEYLTGHPVVDSLKTMAGFRL